MCSPLGGKSGEFGDSWNVRRACRGEWNNNFLILKDFIFDGVKRSVRPVANVQVNTKYHRLTIELFHDVLGAEIYRLAGELCYLQKRSVQSRLRGALSLFEFRKPMRVGRGIPE
jgi:hypothetical protein